MMDSLPQSQNAMEFILKRSLLSKNKMAIINKKQNGKTEYCCVQCPAKYDEKDKLELHLCMHYKEYKFLCGICGTGLKRKEHLDRHTLEHRELRRHACPECGKRFKRKEHLNIHRNIHSSEKTQLCSLCPRSFHRKDHLQKHLMTHSKLLLEQNLLPLNSDGNFLQLKQEIYSEEDEMKPNIRHLEDSIFDTGINMDIQNQNSNEMLTEGEILSEAEMLSEESILPDTDQPPESNQRPYSCCVCFKSYKRKDHLKIHSWTHLRRYKSCSVCGQTFLKDELLMRHIKQHLVNREVESDAMDDDSLLKEVSWEATDDLVAMEHPPASRKSKPSLERRHECPICLKRFKRKQHLKVHAKVHLKQKPTIWCSLCHEGFFVNADFESHECTPPHEGDEAKVEETGPQEGTKPQAGFEPFDMLSVGHVSNDGDENQFEEVQMVSGVTGQAGVPVPQRVFVCKFCSKPFKRKDHYRIHLHTHTGVKSIFCPHCSKGFYRKDHLQKHLLVHQPKSRPKKEIPDLIPVQMLSKNVTVRPEITIHAPSNSKLRVPLDIKVPYQMVVSMDNGEKRSVTIDPLASTNS